MLNGKIFVPWTQEFKQKENIVKLNVNRKENFKTCADILSTDNIAKYFIQALVHDNADRAMNYVSKYGLFNIDFEEMKRLFDGAENVSVSDKYLVNLYFNREKMQKVKSVAIADKNNNVLSVLHFFMVNEPDSFGKWKIIKIIEE